MTPTPFLRASGPGRFRALVRASLALALCLAFTGCASWSKHGIAIEPPRKLRVAVLPVRATVEIKRLKSLQSLPEPAKPIPNEKELIEERLRQAEEEIAGSIEDQLGKSALLEPIPHQEAAKALEALGIRLSSAPLASDQIQGLARSLNAQALLAVDLAGYGKIKRSWLLWLIGTGAVEGIVQGVVIAQVAGPAVAAGVAAEEVAQEAVTWGGGVYLFDRVFTPVILEGRLLSASDGQAFWKKTAFARLNRKALKTYPKDERKRKELRLRLTAEKAAKQLVKALEKAAKRNGGGLSKASPK